MYALLSICATGVCQAAAPRCHARPRDAASRFAARSFHATARPRASMQNRRAPFARTDNSSTRSRALAQARDPRGPAPRRVSTTPLLRDRERPRTRRAETKTGRGNSPDPRAMRTPSPWTKPRRGETVLASRSTLGPTGAGGKLGPLPRRRYRPRRSPPSAPTAPPHKRPCAETAPSRPTDWPPLAGDSSAPLLLHHVLELF